MAAKPISIQFIDGKPTYAASDTLKPQFAEVGVGASNINLKDDAGRLVIGAEIKATEATQTDSIPTKGQLDTAVGGVQGNLDTAVGDLQGQITQNGEDISGLDGRLDTAEGTITAHGGTLTTHGEDIAALDGRVDGHDATLTDHGERITAVEGEVDTLQSDMSAVLANNPKEQSFISNGVDTVFNLTEFQVSADNAVRDMELFVDGRRMIVDVAGGLDEDYRKNSTAQFELAYAVLAGKRITAYKQGTSVATGGSGGSVLTVKDEGSAVESAVIEINFTGAGVEATRSDAGRVTVNIPGGGGGGSDLEAIIVDIQPSTVGGHSVGTLEKPWAAIFVKDEVTDDIWKISVASGVFGAVKVN